MKISAVILSKNEEKNIKDCIGSLAFCDEIIVIDDHSNDQTTQIAHKLGAKVITRSLGGDFAAQRNYGLKKAQYEWVLFIDCDERISKDLKNEILNKIKTGQCDAFIFKRCDYLWNKKMLHGEISKVRLLRMARKDAGKWVRQVHEKWKVKGGISGLTHPILHFTHKNVSEFVNDIDFYSGLHANSNLMERKRSSLFKIMFMPIAHLFKNYILAMGFLDKMPGFVAAGIMSFHSFLSWSKLYLLQKQKIK